jgi:hypothetical protein
MTTKEIVHEHLKSSRSFEKQVLSSPKAARKFLVRIGLLPPKARKTPRCAKS